MNWRLNLSNNNIHQNKNNSCIFLFFLSRSFYNLPFLFFPRTHNEYPILSHLYTIYSILFLSSMITFCLRFAYAHEYVYISIYIYILEVKATETSPVYKTLIVINMDMRSSSRTNRKNVM